MNRTPLELVAFAAWINCPPDRIPAEYRQHTCEATMIAWRRVVAAIVAEVQAPRPYMGQVMAECDCTSQELCLAHRRCIANG